MTEQPKQTHIQELVFNKKALFQYEVVETIETGIVLQGTEIKALRQHGASIQEAYVTVDGNALWLINASIAPYSFGSVYNHEEKRKRKLLAHKREIATVRTALQEKGLTCVPLSVYIKNGKAKVKIAIVKGKKLYDKRESIKERDDKRSMQRLMKQQ